MILCCSGDRCSWNTIARQRAELFGWDIDEAKSRNMVRVRLCKEIKTQQRQLVLNAKTDELPVQKKGKG